MTADALLVGLCREVMEDVLGTRLLLSEAEVRGYVRREHGRLEEVRPHLSGRAAHEHVGLPAGLTAQEQESLNRLRHNLYERLDPYLRRGDLHPARLEPEDKDTSPGEMNAHVSHLDAAFSKARPTVKPLVVYRGFHMKLPAAGGEFTDKSFTSTSTDLGHASAFAWNERGTRRMPLARIVIPPGSRVISQANLGIKRYNDIGGAKWNPDVGAGFDPSGEEEILLNRGSRFRVVGQHRESSSYDIGQGPVKQWHTVLDLEMLPVEENPAVSGIPAKLLPADFHQVKATASQDEQRHRRFVWEPGDIEITHPPVPGA